jgi:hypothetical protein
MALYKITAKKTGTWGNVHFEKGMSVEVSIQGATSSSESIKKVKEAFLNKYSLDIEHLHSSTYLDYEKIN